MRFKNGHRYVKGLECKMENSVLPFQVESAKPYCKFAGRPGSAETIPIFIEKVGLEDSYQKGWLTRRASV